MTRTENSNHVTNFKIEGYKDLGWQNGWKTIHKEENGIKTFDYEGQPEYENCRSLGHKTREIDNSLFLYRGTDNIVICDICKIYSHYDCSD